MSSTPGQITPNSALALLIGATAFDAQGNIQAVSSQDALNTLTSTMVSGERELGIDFEIKQRTRNDLALSNPSQYIANERNDLEVIKRELAAEYDAAKIRFMDEYSMSNEKAAAQAKKRFDANLAARMVEHRIKYPTTILSGAESKIRGAKVSI